MVKILVIKQRYSKKKNLELLREKREEIIEIASKHGAYNVRVFDSVARGEADEKSDIDFLIDYDIKKIYSLVSCQIN